MYGMQNYAHTNKQTQAQTHTMQKLIFGFNMLISTNLSSCGEQTIILEKIQQDHETILNINICKTCEAKNPDISRMQL